MRLLGCGCEGGCSNVRVASSAHRGRRHSARPPLSLAHGCGCEGGWRKAHVAASAHRARHHCGHKRRRLARGWSHAQASCGSHSCGGEILRVWADLPARFVLAHRGCALNLACGFVAGCADSCAACCEGDCAADCLGGFFPSLDFCCAYVHNQQAGVGEEAGGYGCMKEKGLSPSESHDPGLHHRLDQLLRVDDACCPDQAP